MSAFERHFVSGEIRVSNCQVSERVFCVCDQLGNRNQKVNARFADPAETARGFLEIREPDAPAEIEFDALVTLGKKRSRTIVPRMRC